MPSRESPGEVLLLRSERERLRREHAAGASGLAVARGISDAVDAAIVSMWARLAPEASVALVAVGGYGRRLMNPASDVDLMVLHTGGSVASEAAKQLFYELWDAGLTVGHSIRTVKEAIKVARGDLDAETAFLEARLVAGDQRLFEEFYEATMRRTRSSPEAFLQRIREATFARRARSGDASAELEPNLKEGRGGLRDLHAIAWLRMVCDLKSERAGDLDSAAELLHRVRNELHFLTGRHTDVLLMQHQPSVAAALVGPGEENVLMRALYQGCRAVGFALDSLLDGSPVPVPVLPPAEAYPIWSPESRAAFLGLLASGEAGRAAFRVLEESGALTDALPEWEAIRCLPQRNVYHRYPVDVHAFETVVELVRLAGSGDELVRRVVADTRGDWEAVILAGLLHDIGKGTKGDHSIVGEKIARSAVVRLGLSDPPASDVVWLVRNHLLLSDTATRRDIDEESLVVEMAEFIGTLTRLRMLFLVSIADGVATGPAAWTPWKAALVIDLFTKVGHLLERGELVSPDASETARLRIAELRGALSRFPNDGVEQHLAGMPRAWLLSQSIESLIRQSALMLSISEDELEMHATPAGEPRVWEVTVVARDRPGLFSKVSGALALHGLNVLAAQIFTRADGTALEVFRVETIDAEGDRFDRVRDDVRKALRGRLSLDVRLASKRRDYATRYPKGKREEPRVIVDNRVSDFHTVIEVHAPDRIGLLYSITRALSDLELDIHLAKVATYAEDVVDTFYVRDLEGQKVADGEHAREIERSVLLRLATEV